VLLFQDPTEPGTWIAQALERDIAAHGSDVSSARTAFERTVAGYVKQLGTGQDIDPLSSLQPAPLIFWDLWNRTVSASVQAERISTIPAFLIPVVTHESLPA
jgi:hypothetical protein